MNAKHNRSEPYRPHYDTSHTHAFLSHLLSPEMGCIEMRVFNATENRNLVGPAAEYRKTYAGWYDEPHSLAVDVARLRNVSAYVTLNPVNPDLLARSWNLLTRAKTTTTDDDIVCLRWLYVDIDPTRSADISSNDEELQRAVKRRDEILAADPDMKSSALWGKSGNGAWILARLPDLPNNDAGRAFVSDSLDDLSARFSDDHVKIDVKTKNPSRVMCLPGTRKCKGSDMPNRPHRMVTLDGPIIKRSRGTIIAGKVGPR